MNFFRFFVVFSFLWVNVASARDLQVKFQDWGFFKTNRGDRVVCYVMSLPRGEAFVMVTNIENNADEVSISSGVNYHERLDIELSFGTKKYHLFPDKSRAWAYDNNQDIEITKQMQKNSDVIVSAVSIYNENVSDTYSLIGFADAYKKMKKNCK
jgi:hypothetical protein